MYTTQYPHDPHDPNNLAAFIFLTSKVDNKHLLMNMKSVYSELLEEEDNDSYDSYFYGRMLARSLVIEDTIYYPVLNLSLDEAHAKKELQYLMKDAKRQAEKNSAIKHWHIMGHMNFNLHGLDRDEFKRMFEHTGFSAKYLLKNAFDMLLIAKQHEGVFECSLSAQDLQLEGDIFNANTMNASVDIDVNKYDAMYNSIENSECALKVVNKSQIIQWHDNDAQKFQTALSNIPNYEFSMDDLIEGYVTTAYTSALQSNDYFNSLNMQIVSQDKAYCLKQVSEYMHYCFEGNHWEKIHCLNFPSSQIENNNNALFLRCFKAGCHLHEIFGKSFLEYSHKDQQKYLSAAETLLSQGMLVNIKNLKLVDWLECHEKFEFSPANLRLGYANILDPEVMSAKLSYPKSEGMFLSAKQLFLEKLEMFDLKQVSQSDLVGLYEQVKLAQTDVESPYRALWKQKQKNEYGITTSGKKALHLLKHLLVQKVQADTRLEIPDTVLHNIICENTGKGWCGNNTSTYRKYRSELVRFSPIFKHHHSAKALNASC